MPRTLPTLACLALVVGAGGACLLIAAGGLASSSAEHSTLPAGGDDSVDAAVPGGGEADREPSSTGGPLTLRGLGRGGARREEVRREASRVHTVPTSSDVEAALAGLLGARGPAERLRIANDLHRMAVSMGAALDPQWRQGLCDALLQSDSAVVRRVLGRSLACVGRDGALTRRLLGALSGRVGDRRVAAGVLVALAGVATPEDVPALRPYATPDRPEVEAEVLATVGRIGGASAEDWILGLLAGDVSASTRRAAEAAWRELASEQNAERIAQALPDSGSAAQISMLGILRQDPPPESAVLLGSLLRSSTDERVRKETLETLAACGDAGCVERILEVARGNSTLARAADRALIRVKRTDGLETAVRSWAVLGDTARQSVLQAGVRADEVPESMLAVARQELRNGTPGTQKRAVALLGRHGGTEASASVLDYLARAASEGQRRAAVVALTRTAGEEDIARAQAILDSRAKGLGEQELSALRSLLARAN